MSRTYFKQNHFLLFWWKKNVFECDFQDMLFNSFTLEPILPLQHFHFSTLYYRNRFPNLVLAALECDTKKKNLLCKIIHRQHTNPHINIHQHNIYKVTSITGPILHWILTNSTFKSTNNVTNFNYPTTSNISRLRNRNQRVT